MILDVWLKGSVTVVLVDNGEGCRRRVLGWWLSGFGCFHTMAEWQRLKAKLAGIWLVVAGEFDGNVGWW